MTWIDAAWTIMASACLTLGLVHLFVWNQQRSQYSHLLFFLLAASVSAVGAFELAMMRAETPAAYATALRWAHVPLCIAVLSLVGFVRLYFDAGRAWLAYAICATRLLALALNFGTGANLNYSSVSTIDHVTLWGANASIPIGVASPWQAVAQASNLLLAIFIVDASVTLWRRGGRLARRRAMVVGGSLALSTLVVSSFTLLIVTGTVHAPTILTPAFIVFVLAMGYELGHDVMRASQLSRELRQSERRIELAAQATRIAFWTYDLTRGEVWLTAKGRELFEFDPSTPVDLGAMLGRVHPDDREALRVAIGDSSRDGRQCEIDFRLALPSGTARWIAARFQGASDIGGVAPLLHGVALDVTERLRLEREATQQRAELAHLSRVATLGELAGSIAHEINQPLMGILANAEAAQSFVERIDGQVPELREILADIVEDDKRAGEVIRRLRAMLRKGEAQRGPVDLNGVVGDVAHLMRNDLLNREVALSLGLEAPLPSVSGDRIQLQQVVLNLVMNACEAMDGLRDSRQIRICSRLANASEIEVSVCDHGRGAAPEDLERLFEPFFTTKAQGMGLGLSICRSIIDAHGGRLWASRNPDAGMTFRFVVPVDGAKP